MRSTLILLTIFLLAPLPVFAQPVHIPDPNLRAAISEELDGAPITRHAIGQLRELSVGKKGITDLTGLEHATNLTYLGIYGNPITDLTPIAGLTKLNTIYMWETSVSDLTPLANLKKLRVLHAPYCGEIVDISPLANLTQLEKIDLVANKIVDISPLAGLTKLRVLKIQHNQIVDHSPLDGLDLTVFEYDDNQPCNASPAASTKIGESQLSVGVFRLGRLGLEFCA